MKICKRILPLLLVLLLLPLGASAAGYVDLDRTTSLTITAKFNDMPMTGMKFNVYRVSDMDKTGELTVRQAYIPFAAELDIRGKNDAAWQAVSEKLARWLSLNPQIKPTAEAVVKENGLAELGDLPMGLYLVTSQGLEKDDYVYTVAPFFLVFPQRDEKDQWNYDISAMAKPVPNAKKTDYRVIKLWKDTCHPEKRPQTITVQLYCDGVAYGEAVTLPENGHWSHTWEDLEVNHVWTVTESGASGYAPDVTAEGTTFVITNTHTHPDTPTDPTTPTNPTPPTTPTTPGKPGKLPQTGQLWWPVPVLLCGGLLCLVIGLIRRRGARHEG